MDWLTLTEADWLAMTEADWLGMLPPAIPLRNTLSLGLSIGL